MSATPPKRIARRERVGGYSPPSAAAEDEAPGTPGPTRARINHLENQVRELVRKTHAAERKHRAEVTTLEGKLADRDANLAIVARRADDETRKSAKLTSELERCKTEGAGMRQELNLYSLVQQQKAVLALADEQLHIVELEQRLLKAESERVMRDHKLVLFQSREDDMLAEVEDKEARIAELEEALETANTSLVHQLAAEQKAAAVVSSSKDEFRAEVEALQAKLVALEEEHANVCAVNTKNVEKYQKLKEKEKEAQAEIKRLMSEERPDPSADSDKAELKAQLRLAKVEAVKRAEEAADLAEELATLQETSKEREKALKAKYREAQEERNRLAAVEVELEALKAANAKAATKPKKEPVKKKAAARPASPVSKAKARKTSPASDSDDEPPKKKAPKASSRAKSVPADSDSENAPPKDKDADSDVGNKSTASAPDKKKKRKLFGVQTAFQWDPVLNSGDGVIPTFLSPVRPAGASGTIPRAGLGGISARNLSRF